MVGFPFQNSMDASVTEQPVQMRRCQFSEKFIKCQLLGACFPQTHVMYCMQARIPYYELGTASWAYYCPGLVKYDPRDKLFTTQFLHILDIPRQELWTGLKVNIEFESNLNKYCSRRLGFEEDGTDGRDNSKSSRTPGGPSSQLLKAGSFHLILPSLSKLVKYKALAPAVSSIRRFPGSSMETICSELARYQVQARSIIILCLMTNMSLTSWMYYKHIQQKGTCSTFLHAPWQSKLPCHETRTGHKSHVPLSNWEGSVSPHVLVHEVLMYNIFQPHHLKSCFHWPAVTNSKLLGPFDIYQIVFLPNVKNPDHCVTSVHLKMPERICKVLERCMNSVPDKTNPPHDCRSSVRLYPNKSHDIAWQVWFDFIPEYMDFPDAIVQCFM